MDESSDEEELEYNTDRVQGSECEFKFIGYEEYVEEIYRDDD